MNPEECDNCTRETNPNTATPDEEVWVRKVVHTAIKMSLALQVQQKVGADNLMKDFGIRGIAVGATIEILNTLDKRPNDGYVNLGDFEY